ncbi:MAG TPA: sulfatase [Candidatus Eisenbacteria bacterium]|nr:sulfatase [Candidatus Eisenbacteria bacterium]
MLRGRGATLLCLIAIGCATLSVGCRRPGAPAEVVVTDLAYGAVDGVAGPLPVADLDGVRALLQQRAGTIDVWLRLPADPVLRFRIEPPAPAPAIRITTTVDGAEREATPVRSESGEWTAHLAGGEGDLARLRLESRQPMPIAWRDVRVAGTATAAPPPLAARLRPPEGQRINVIVVLVDALRADHLSVYGYPRDTSPNLAALAAHGVVFTQAYAAGPSTLNSIPSLFTSRYPSEVGAKFQQLAIVPKTLAETFHDAGYQTAAFVVNRAVLGNLGFGRGFDTYDHPITSPSTQPGQPAPTDRVLVRTALGWITRHASAPFFAYVHTLDVHDRLYPLQYRGRFDADGRKPPATPPRARDRVALGDFHGAAREMELEARGSNLTNVYDETIAWTDQQLGDLVEGLGVLGIRDRTAIVVVADHGDALGPEDDGTHGHAHSLYQELVRVPFVMGLPWTGSRRDVDQIVSLLDVAPTVASLAGVAPSSAWVGRDLFAPGRPLDAPSALMERLEPPWGPKAMIRPGLYGVAEWGVRRGNWKLLIDGTHTRLFDLTSDPKETRDVAAEHPDAVAELQAHAWRRSPALAEGRIQSGRLPLDLDEEKRRELLDALRALGYVE